MLARKLFAVVLPAALLASAGLHAQAITALVEATATAAPVLPMAPPKSHALAAPRPDADRILARNPFEHGAQVKPPVAGVAPIDCTGVRALVVVRAEDEDASLVALDLGGQRMLRRRGQEAGDLVVAWVGADRAWLTRGDQTCEARVFARAAAVHPEPKRHPGIARMSPTEVHIERATLDRLLESPGELAKIRVVADASGIRIAMVPANSVLSVLGIEEGDRLVSAGGIDLTSPEKIMELYARLRTFERLSIVVDRKGRPTTMDYVVK